MNALKKKNFEINDILTFVTVGSVDDGKSTLIGRLLYDSKSVFIEQLEAIERLSKQKGNENLDLALLVDGLKAEREQGITIDVAYRYFSTAKRKFIIADTPGHIEYTRNMVTGASNANLIIVLIDARKGVLEQTKRHSFIASLLQIQHFIVCINKMDLVNYNEAIFERIKQDYEKFAQKLDVKEIHFIPICALTGENVVMKSNKMKWYEGPTLLYLLENIYVKSDRNLRDCRFPVQYVIRPQTKEYPEYRGYAGRIASGIYKPGDKIMVLPSGFQSVITKIETFDGPLIEAYPYMSVTIRIQDDIDISRGDMIVRPLNSPNIGQDIDLIICWLNHRPLNISSRYIVKHTTREIFAFVKEIVYKIDINSLHKIEGNNNIGLNDIARVKIRTSQPIFYDSYSKNKITGSLIFIDEITNETVAAGMIK